MESLKLKDQEKKLNPPGISVLRAEDGRAPIGWLVDREALHGTISHPLYSLDRDDWVRIRDLQVGERLQIAEGAVTVEALEKVGGVRRVYNLEVEGDHEYLVGESGPGAQC